MIDKAILKRLANRGDLNSIIAIIFYKYNKIDFRVSHLKDALIEFLLYKEFFVLEDIYCVQIAISNSIVLFEIGRSDLHFDRDIKYEHSFGGLHFTPMRLVAQFNFGDEKCARIYMHESEIHPSPSVVRSNKSNTVVLNNFLVFHDFYFKNSVMRYFDFNDEVCRAPLPEAADNIIDVTVDVIVPVWNSPNLFEGFFSDLNSSDISKFSNLRLIIRDDHSDDFSKAILIDCISSIKLQHPNLDIVFIDGNENIGFINSSNMLYRECKAEFVVLLTTDIRLPEEWLKRLIEPFLRNSEVALATPYAVNGSNLNIDLPRGSDWKDLDIAARKILPSYPDAETNVGYCLALRRSALYENEQLFSPIFNNGYGDDSDLYYRMVSRKKRGVVVDNLVIFHKSGGSFNNLPGVEQLRSINLDLFLERWHKSYLEKITSRLAIVNNKASEIVSVRAEELSIGGDVLFILPIDNRVHGGVEIVFRFTDYLREKGIKCNILSLRKSENTLSQGKYRSFTIEDLLNEKIFPHKIVISTSHDTVTWGASLSKIWDIPLWYFVQGPEIAFSGGAYIRSVLDTYSVCQRYICVSDYLVDYVYHVAGVQAECINLGPDSLEFYQTNEIREKAVVVQFAGRTDKGSDLAAIAVASLTKAGFKIYAFGNSELVIDYPDNVEFIGFASHGKLRKLFQKSMYYIDLSRYEGLGLLSLEALYCGAIPVTLGNGGSAYEIIHAEAGIIIDNLIDVHRLGQKLESYEIHKQHCSLGMIAVKEKMSFQKSAAVMMEKINDHIAKL